MELQAFGFTPALSAYCKENSLEGFDIGRIAAEHKERYVVWTESGSYNAEITGNLRFSATSRSDFPAVGDWVAVRIFDESLAIIHQVLPRHSVLERKAVGKVGEKQIIAANLDAALIIQGADQDFNLNRLERYLTICYAAGIKPHFLLSKIDLVDEPEWNAKLDKVRQRRSELDIFPFSNLTKIGYPEIDALFKPGKTYCFIGSSGVGKSTLSNHLSGTELMKTSAISNSTNKGRHTTSHREMILLSNGSILIDTPGMREIGVIESVEETFDAILLLAQSCKYNDCSHQQEEGCAILQAIDEGELEYGAYENFLKMKRESAHFQSTIAEKRKKDKAFGKMAKEIMKHRRKTKF